MVFLQVHLEHSSPPQCAKHLYSQANQDGSSQGFPGDSVVKKPPANAGDTGLIPGLGRYLEKEMTTYSSIFACEIPWAEEHAGLQSMRSQKSQTRLSD